MNKVLAGVVAVVTLVFFSNGAAQTVPHDIRLNTTRADLTAGSVTPTAVFTDEHVLLSAQITNLTPGVVPLAFSNLFQIDVDEDHTSVTSLRSSPLVGIGSLSERSVSVPYSFPTPGTWYVRACADNNPLWMSAIREAEENNNCGDWTPVIVSKK